MRGSEKLKDTVLYSYVLLGTVQLEGDGHIIGSPSMLQEGWPPPSAEPPVSKEALRECFMPVTWCLKVMTCASAILLSIVELLAPPSVSVIFQCLTMSGHKALQRFSRRYRAELTYQCSLGCQVWPHWHVRRK